MPLSIANLSAWVEIDGTQAECYAKELSEDGKKATCWIASESGKACRLPNRLVLED